MHTPIKAHEGDFCERTRHRSEWVRRERGEREEEELGKACVNIWSIDLAEAFCAQWWGEGHIVCTPVLLSHNWLSIQKALFPPLWAQIKICPLCTNDGHLKTLSSPFQNATANTLSNRCSFTERSTFESVWIYKVLSPIDSCCFQPHSEPSCALLWMMGENPACGQIEGRGNGKSSVISPTLSR